jgi:hypothetical protein
MKRAIIQPLFLAIFVMLLVGSGRAQNLDLEFSSCNPLSCRDSKITATGAVFVQIDGSCFNGAQVQAGVQLAIIRPCQTPVSLSVEAGEEHTQQLDECGRLYVLGGVFAKGQADNGSQPTGSVFDAESCDGAQTETPPGFDPC